MYNNFGGGKVRICQLNVRDKSYAVGEDVLERERLILFGWVRSV